MCIRDRGNYVCTIKLQDLAAVANAEKKIPDEWINADGNGLTNAYLAYALPLIQGEPASPKINGLPSYARLKKVRAQ